jgi:hypothetical protein
MAGMLLKDHTTSTVGRVQVLNAWSAQDTAPAPNAGPHFISALALNPPAGGLNPFAVEAALREGVDVVFLPTYSARHQIAVHGPDAFVPAYPRPVIGSRPGAAWLGLTVLNDAGTLKDEVLSILDMIAEYDAILATGHISPQEALAVLAEAQRRGVQRMIVTHASSKAPGLSVAEQQEAVGYGAYIEHCLMGILQADRQGLGDLVVDEMLAQIREIDPERVLLSSDLGQAANGPVVAGFARLLDRLRCAGLAEDDMRRMIVENPGRVLGN